MLVSHTIEGIPASIDRQRAIQARLTDMTPVMTLLLAEFYAIEEDLFNEQGATGEHGQWDEIKDSTRLRRKEKKDGPILDDTGALRDSLTRGNALGSRRRITPHSFEAGSDLDRAAYVAAGGRRPIDFTASQVEYFNYQVERYVMGEIL